MTQTAKLDITRPDQRGLTLGLNEFSGYVGVAGAGIITGYLATALGARLGLALFGAVVIVLAIVLTLLWVKDTRPWAYAEAKKHAAGASGLAPRYPKNISSQPSTWSVHAHDRRQATDGRLPGGAGQHSSMPWCVLQSSYYRHQSASAASGGLSACTDRLGRCASPGKLSMHGAASGECGCAVPASP
jgi:MFS family permease